ncbi:MAG TPA: 50S ribosomal protein L23 [Candidatus Saccharimonadales bacterium]|nr:50S ribosomal protein L23 [Candidatus Saccharimonadales bacterium]
MDKQIVLKPRLSEKTYAQSAGRVYTFDVAGNVNKHSVAHAVEAQFDVQVMKVNIANIPGKAKRSVSKKGRLVARGRESDLKKAYVTLVEGQSLPFFAAAEEAEAKEAKQAEKAAKKAAKETK